MGNTIEINGEIYVPREHKSPKVSPRVASILMMGMMMGGGLPGLGGSGPERPDVDIVEEYKLILQKKSFLSASDRRWVEYRFHDKFKKVNKDDEL